MTSGTEGWADGPLVVELRIADEPAAWAGAGFAVDGEVAQVASVAIRLVGRDRADGGRGIVGWTLAGVHVAGDLDGLPTDLADAPTPGVPSTGTAHPNGVTSIDHVVVLTPDLERTIEACAAAGLELKRIRETTSYGSPMRQAFFRLGPTILEVVSGDTGSGVAAAESPATWFGLAVNARDLDQTRALLGDALGEPKAAVQAGRRIATFRHRALDLSVPLAAMDDHADR